MFQARVSHGERCSTGFPAGAMGEPEAEGDEGQADGCERRDVLVEQEGAEDGGGEGAQSEEDSDARGACVLEGPQPKEVTDPAAEADEDDGGPSAHGDVGQRGHYALAPGQGGEKD